MEKLSDEFLKKKVSQYEFQNLSPFDIKERIKIYGLICGIEARIEADQDTLATLNEINSDLMPLSISGLLAGLKVVIQDNNNKLDIIRKQVI